LNYAAMRYLTQGGCPVEGAAWQVVAVIAWHADKTTGDSYVSRRNIATEARLSTGTVHMVLADLIGRGVLEIVVAGAGRRAMTYRIACDSVIESQADGVVAQSTDRSGSVDLSVVAQSTGASIGGREEQEGFEGKSAAASTAPTDPTADAIGRRSASGNGQVPPDAAAAIAALKASSRRVPTVPVSQPGSDAPPVSAAAADAQQAAPDKAARPTRRSGRGKRHRGREPPARCPRSHPTPREMPMANHKRRRPKARRAGCLWCKPQKLPANKHGDKAKARKAAFKAEATA